ncbi:MAG: tRNA lysidine(34) synthetase TilS [Clostridia bacterium]|nr:tRNA lysidine(34) synthetase TilS [Clostridia bacterium]
MNAELQVRKTIKDHNMIAPGDTVILGLSGGPDSLCLLHILKDMQRSLDFTLQALHVNHLMRGEQAAEDERWLADHCRQLGVPLVVTICNVYAKAEKEGISPEEAGRKARHSALRRQQASLQGYCSMGCGGGRALIALAHNRDDQAETVLMRMLRGTGIHGLAAMEYARADGLIRPLLDTPRSEIEAYCEGHGLKPRWDCTNADTYYTRNKLRRKLLPALEKEYNPSLKEGLARLAAAAREDDAFLESLAQKEAEGHVDSFPVKRLAALEAPIAKRIVRILFARLGLEEDIAAAHLESLLAAAKGRRTGKTIEFPHGYTARVTHEDIEFVKP